MAFIRYVRIKNNLTLLKNIEVNFPTLRHQLHKFSEIEMSTKRRMQLDDCEATLKQLGKSLPIVLIDSLGPREPRKLGANYLSCSGFCGH